MTVTSTSLGANTVHINVSGESTPTNIISAIDAAITGAGWSQVDISNPYNRIYNALNQDGSTYKYMGISIDPGTLRITTTCYESWNATTHVGLNEAWTFNRAGCMGFAYNYCDILVMVNQRWCFLQTFIRNQASCWSGVIELAREAPEDTAAAGYPCWCWVSSATVMTSQPASVPVIGAVSFPRTVGGLTGYAAASTNSLQTPYTRFGAASQLGQAFSTLPNYTTYAWNTADKIVHSTRPVVGTTELHGRMFGMKLTYNIGSPYTQVTMPIDSNYAYSATGTQTLHWVLGGVPSVTPQQLLNGTINYPSGSTVTQTLAMGTGNNITCAEPVGYYYYVGTQAGVFIVDGSTTTLNLIGVVSGTSGQSIYTIVYDNYQYVYASGATGIYRIDTLNNNNTTFLATSSMGISGMWWDGTYLWAGIRTAATSNQLFQITPSSYSITGTVTLSSASQWVGAICSDNAGNTYALTNSGSLYKIVNSTLAVTSLLATGWTTINSTGMWFNGVQLHIACSSAATVYYKTVSLSGTVLLTGSYAANSSLSSYTNCMTVGKFGAYDYYGGGYSQYCTVFTTDMSGTLTSTPNTQMPNLTLTAFQTDENRAFGGYTTTFYLWTNVYRPDDQTTSYGRLLLPQ